MSAPETLRELRRGQIITVARKIVAEEGLEALTIGSLESRLSFSRGVITYHFQNKDDIVYAVLESAIEEINASTAAQLRPDLAPDERLSIVLRTYVKGWVEHVEAGRILLSFWGRIPSDKRARKANASLYAAYRRGAARMLETGMGAGEYVKDVDIDATAALLVGIVLGIATQTYFEKNAIDHEGAVGEAVRMVCARLIPAGPSGPAARK
jgi:AcrR family transcriptional regulator